MQAEKAHYTRNVTTPLYRAPECFLGMKVYSSKAEIWAAGLIIYELVMHQPLLPTDSELGVLFGIFKILGFPNE